MFLVLLILVCFLQHLHASGETFPVAEHFKTKKNESLSLDLLGAAPDFSLKGAFVAVDNVIRAGVFATGDGQCNLAILSHNSVTLSSFYNFPQTSPPYQSIGEPSKSQTFGGFNKPQGVWYSPTGDLFVADTLNFVIKAFNSEEGSFSVIAGRLGHEGHDGDNGPATSATLYSPVGGVLDVHGNHYIVDLHGCTVRRISGDLITTVYGVHRRCGLAQGGLFKPNGIALVGTNLIVSELSGNRITQLNPNSWTATTIIGNPGTPGFTPDGPYSAGNFVTRPTGVVGSGSNSLFFADGRQARVLDLTNNFVHTFMIDMRWIRGVSFSGTFLAVVDTAAHRIVVVDFSKQN